MPKIKLTPLEEDVLKFINEWEQAHPGQSPPITVIAKRFEVSVARAGQYCESLTDKGWIELGDTVQYRPIVFR